MRFTGLTAGVVDGAGTFLLTKNKACFYVDECIGVQFMRLRAFGVARGARWRATIAALRFIWIEDGQPRVITTTGD